MKTKIALTVLALAGLSFSRAADQADKPVDKPADPKPLVQIAILLDNSGSMKGLIAQAKSQLWNIVNEFIAARQDGQAPRVEVALYEYGINGEGEKGYIRFQSPLTEDLDKLSEQLFAINPANSGSQEYCGTVIKNAVSELKWDKSPKTYKAIFIAGNETFDQGKVDYQTACKQAITKGIIVNTIHCGEEKKGIADHWKEAAAISDGRFLNINHNQVAAAPPAPQDKEIAELNGKLNGTYVTFGARGGEGRARQLEQDQNAESSATGAFSARAASKASANYRNSTWDLVDHSQDKDFDITKVKDEDLPEEMRKMTVDERKQYLEKKRAERAELQKRIGELATAREKFIAEDAKTQAGATLGGAVTEAVRDQAKKKGMTFEKPEAPKPEAPKP